MAKKLGKFLLGMAAIGGAAAAAYYYLQKKDAVTITPECDDEDYDDFSDELDETSSRNYVQLNKEVVEEAAAKVAETAESTEEVITDVADAVEEAVDTAEAVVEEFFDEEKSAE